MTPWHAEFPLQEKIFFADEHVVLYHGNCTEIVPLLPLETMFCFTDPIYNVGKDYGECKDDMSMEDYLAFCAAWKGPLARCQANCIYTPNKWALQYWAMLGPAYKPVILTWTAAAAIRGKWIGRFSMMLTNAVPTQPQVPDWWPDTQRAGLGYLCKEATFDHPGYTSEDITNRVIQYLAPADATLLDPFAGSGTTLWCAKLRGRRAVGIELDRQWCEVIRDRCRQTVLPLGAG